MENFRRRTRESQRRQAVDGFINAPIRSGSKQPDGRRRLHFSGLRSTNNRTVDDFKRAEGLHVFQNGVRAAGVPKRIDLDQRLKSKESAKPAPKAQARAATRARQPSLLNTTLSNSGQLSAKKKGIFGRKQKDKDSGKAKTSRWRKFRKWGLRSAFALTALALVLGGFLIFKGVLNLNKVFKGGGEASALDGDVTPDLLKGEGDGRVNILLLGKGGDGHAGADLTDTIILASMDPVNKDTTLVSIPRDLWVTVSGFGSGKINAVYANIKNQALSNNPNDRDAAERAGIDKLQDAVSEVLGIPIHYYGMVDFEGFKKAIDIVGGVDIDVPEDLAVRESLWDSTARQRYYLDVPPGPQHFDSTKALYFTRSRQTSLRGDFSRSERQRILLQAVGQKVLSAGTYTNPVKVSQLMSAFGDHFSTDLSLSNVTRLVELSKGMDLSKLESIGLADPPNNYLRTDNLQGQSIVRPTIGIGDYSEIHNFIRNTLRDPYLAQEDGRVAILNGTAISGLASRKAEELRSYGYNVTVVDDAPSQDYNQTVLIDLTNDNKPFTRNYLEKRLKSKVTTQLPDDNIQTQDIDFVIILGQDAQN